MSLVILYFFFFQAEDGIRDYKVTGVQTCALPISASQARASTRLTCSSDRGRTIQRGTRPSTAALTRAAVSDRKSTRLNSSHLVISYAVFCLKKKKNNSGAENKRIGSDHHRHDVAY